MSTAIQQLNLNNLDLFYYTYFYFKDNGVSPVTKAFATDRLTKLNNWYIAANNDPNVPQSYNQIILNWAFKYLMIEHPEVTWDEFYELFLITHQEIIDGLSGYPCAQSILQQLPNLNNDISLALKNTFQNSEKYRITFRVKSGLGDVDGYTKTDPKIGSDTFFATIFLNDEILKNATKEYILITMYHEVIHAYLDFELKRLGQIQFEQDYPVAITGADYALDGTIVNRYAFNADHQNFGPFLNTLENILSTYNPNLPGTTVKALAKSGIATTTIDEKILNSNEKNILLGNYKGTKCP